MNRFKVGDRVYYKWAAATIVPSDQVNGYPGDYNYLIKFDVVLHNEGYDWEGHENGSVRYVYDAELEPLKDEGFYSVVGKQGNGFLRATCKPGTPYTLDTAIDAAREFSKDGNEYLVLKAVASVKIPQAEPVVTTL